MPLQVERHDGRHTVAPALPALHRARDVRLQRSHKGPQPVLDVPRRRDCRARGSAAGGPAARPHRRLPHGDPRARRTAYRSGEYFRS